MTQPAIRFEHVSKKFVIRHERPRSFQEVAVSLFRNRDSREELWAVRDVSFTVAPGETLGLIGPNGSGKSTILKLISRILEPTKGDIEGNGRLSSRVELGAGFHPDLTGRENIYLNGLILGLTRRELDACFDDIVRFSELERFIDMPVKHYSSGMAMRLGFAVAVHVRPEILLVDEVLAVGDAEFQSKCYAHMEKLRQDGVTIIIASHDLPSIQRYTDRAVLLEQGRIALEGKPAQVLHEYLTRVFGPASATAEKR